MHEQLLAAPCVWVGFSGGLDSRLLLELASELLPRDSLRALHVNHAMQADADRWEAFCADTAARLGVAFSSHRVTLQSGVNREAAAREARYEVFKTCLGAGELLLLAHHADDQAETLLLRLMRGSGLRGLGAMPVGRPLGRGQLLRPLLSYSRQALELMARERSLQWIEDPSNQDVRLRRNFLRREILPRLKAQWQQAAVQIAEAATGLQQAQLLLDEYAALLISQLEPREEIGGSSLTLAHFNSLSEIQRHLVLRYQLAASAVYPERSPLDEAVRQLALAGPEHHILFDFQGRELRAYAGRLYLLQALRQPRPDEAYTWDGQKALVIPGIGQLEPWCAGEFQVRFRRGGESYTAKLQSSSHRLKDYFQEARVPPWVRERSPLIYLEEELVAVAGLCSFGSEDAPGFTWGGT